MKTLILVLSLSFVGCSPHGVSFGGNFANRFAPSALTLEILIDLEARAVAAAEGLPGLDPARLDGFAVYTKPTPSFELGGVRVAGWCSCDSRLIVVGTPLEGAWERSAVVHEMFHAMQGCYAPPPTDPGLDEDHANWARDGLMRAINRANAR